jgi:hypothetical protein
VPLREQHKTECRQDHPQRERELEAVPGSEQAGEGAGGQADQADGSRNNPAVVALEPKP